MTFPNHDFTMVLMIYLWMQIGWSQKIGTKRWRIIICTCARLVPILFRTILWKLLLAFVLRSVGIALAFVLYLVYPCNQFDRPTLRICPVHILHSAGRFSNSRISPLFRKLQGFKTVTSHYLHYTRLWSFSYFVALVGITGFTTFNFKKLSRLIYSSISFWLGVSYCRLGGGYLLWNLNLLSCTLSSRLCHLLVSHSFLFFTFLELSALSRECPRACSQLS